MSTVVRAVHACQRIAARQSWCVRRFAKPRPTSSAATHRSNGLLMRALVTLAAVLCFSPLIVPGVAAICASGTPYNVPAGVTTLLSGPCTATTTVLSITASNTILQLSSSHNYLRIDITSGLSGVSISLLASASLTTASATGGIYAIGGITTSGVTLSSSATFTNTAGSCFVYNGVVDRLTIATATATISCAQNSVWFKSTSSIAAATLTGTATTFFAGGSFRHIYFEGQTCVSTTVSYGASSLFTSTGTPTSGIYFSPVAKTGNSILGITLSSSRLTTIGSEGIYFNQFIDSSVIGTDVTIISGRSNVMVSNSNGTGALTSMVSIGGTSVLSMTTSDAVIPQANLRFENINIMTITYTGGSLYAASTSSAVIGNVLIGGVSTSVGVDLLSATATVIGSSGSSNGNAISLGYINPGLDISIGISITTSGVSFSGDYTTCFVCLNSFVIGSSISMGSPIFTSATSRVKYYIHAQSGISVTSTSMTFSSADWTGSTEQGLRFDNSFTIPVGASPPIYKIDGLAITFSGTSTIKFAKSFVVVARPIRKLEITARGANFYSTASTPAASYIFAEVNTVQTAYDSLNFTLFLPESGFNDIRIFSSFYRVDGGAQLFHSSSPIAVNGVSVPVQTAGASLGILGLFNYFSTKSNTRTVISFTGGLAFYSASLLHFQDCNGVQATFLGAALQLSAASMVTFTGAATTTQDLVLSFTPTSITITTSGALFSAAASVTLLSSASSFEVTLTAIATVSVSAQRLFQVAGVSSSVSFYITNFDMTFSSHAVSITSGIHEASFSLISSPITCATTAITLGASGNKDISWVASDSRISVASSVGSLAILDCPATCTIKGEFRLTSSGISFSGGTNNDLIRATGPVELFTFHLRQSGIVSISGRMFEASSTVSALTAEFTEVTFVNSDVTNADPFYFASTLQDSSMYFDRSPVTTSSGPGVIGMSSASTVTIRFEGTSSQVLVLSSVNAGVYIASAASALVITMLYVDVTSADYNVLYGLTCTSCELSMNGRNFFKASRNVYGVGTFTGSVKLLGETTMSSTGATAAGGGNVVITSLNGAVLQFASGSGTFTVDTNDYGNVILDGDLNHASASVQILGTNMKAQRDNLKIDGRQYNLDISSGAALTVTSTVAGVNYRNVYGYSSFGGTNRLSGYINIDSSSFTRPSTGSGAATASSNIHIANGISATGDTFLVNRVTFTGANYAVHIALFFDIPTTFTTVYADTLVSATATGFAFTRMGVLFADTCGNSGALATGALSLSDITHIGRVINTVGYATASFPTLKQNFVYFKSSFVQHSIAIFSSTYDRADNYATMQYRFLELDTTRSETAVFAGATVVISTINAMFKQYAYINALTSEYTSAVGSNLKRYQVNIKCFTIRTTDNVVYMKPFLTNSIMEATQITMSGVYAPIGNVAVYIDGIVDNALGTPKIVFDNNILEVNRMVRSTGTSGSALVITAGCGKFGKGNIVPSAFLPTNVAYMSTTISPAFCSPNVGSCFDTLSQSRTTTGTVSLTSSQTNSVSVSDSEEVSVTTSLSGSTSSSLTLSTTLSESASVTPSSTYSLTSSDEISASSSRTTTHTLSVSQSDEVSASRTLSVSLSVSPTETMSPSEEVSLSQSSSVSYSQTTSLSSSFSVSSSFSLSTSVSVSETITSTQTEERTMTTSITMSDEPTLTMSLSTSSSPSHSFSAEESLSRTHSQSFTPTFTISGSLTDELSASETRTESVSSSVTGSGSVSASGSFSMSSTASDEPTASRSVTISISDTKTITLTEERSLTPSSSTSASLSNEVTPTDASRTVTLSLTGTPTISPSIQDTNSISVSPTNTGRTPSATAAHSGTTTMTETMTESPTESLTEEPSSTRTSTPTDSSTGSVTQDYTNTWGSRTPTSSTSDSVTETAQRSRTPSATPDWTTSKSSSLTDERSHSGPSTSATPSNTTSGSYTPTPALSASPTISTELASRTDTITVSSEHSPTLTATATESSSITPSSTHGSPTHTVTYSAPSETPHHSHTVTSSAEDTATRTREKSFTRPRTLSISSSPEDPSSSASSSQTSSVSFTDERTRTATKSMSASPEPPSVSGTTSITGDRRTESVSVSFSRSRSQSVTRSASSEESISGGSDSTSRSVSASPSILSVSADPTSTPTLSDSRSPSGSRSRSGSTTFTSSSSPSRSVMSLSAEHTASASGSTSPTSTSSRDVSVTVPTASTTFSNEHTKTRSKTRTQEHTSTATQSRSLTLSMSSSKSKTADSHSKTLTWFQEPAGLTETPSASASVTGESSSSFTSERSSSSSGTETFTLTVSQSRSRTGSGVTLSMDDSATFTVSQTTTVSYRTLTQTKTHTPTEPTRTLPATPTVNSPSLDVSKTRSVSDITPNKTGSLLATRTFTWKGTFSGSSDVTVTSTVTLTPPPTPTPTTTHTLLDRPPGNLLGFWAGILDDSRCDSNNSFFSINGPLLVVICVLLLCKLIGCRLPCVSVDTYRHVPQWRSLMVQHSYVCLVLPCHFQCFFAHYLLFFLHANILLILVATFALIFPASTSLQAAYSCVFACLVAQLARPLFNNLFYRSTTRRLRLQKRIRDPEDAFVSMEDDNTSRKDGASPNGGGSVASGPDSDWATIEEDENLSSQYNETEEEEESEEFEEMPPESTEEGPLPDAPERDPTDELFNASFSFDEDDYHFTKGKSFKLIMSNGKDDAAPSSIGGGSSRARRQHAGGPASPQSGGDIVIDIDSDYIAGAFDFEDDHHGRAAALTVGEDERGKFGNDTTSISIGSFDEFLDHSNGDGGSGPQEASAKERSLTNTTIKRQTTTSSAGGAAAEVRSLWSMDMGSKASGPLPPPPRELFWDPRRAASEQSNQHYEFDDVAKYSPAASAAGGASSVASGAGMAVRRGTWVAEGDDVPDDAMANLSLSSMSIGSVLSDLSSSYESGADEFEQALRIKFTVRTHYMFASMVTIVASAAAVAAAYYLRLRVDDVPTCGMYGTAIPMVFAFDVVLGQTVYVALVYLNRYLQHDESLRYSRKFSELHPVNDEVRIMSVERGRLYIRKLKESHKYKKELERMRREGVVDRVDRIIEEKHTHRAPPDHVAAFMDDGELTQQQIVAALPPSPHSPRTTTLTNNAGPAYRPQQAPSPSAAASSSSPRKKKKPPQREPSSSSSDSSGSDFDPDAANATKWNPDDEDFDFLASTQRFSTAMEK